MQVRTKERELEDAERTRQLRLWELWEEAWASVGYMPPDIPWLERTESTPSSETVESNSSMSTLILPPFKPVACPSVPQPLEIGGTES